VSAEHIKAAVSELSPDTEAATARALVDRRLAGTRGQPAAARATRLVAVLARKGYPPALAYRVVREALEQDGLDIADAGLDLSDGLPDAGVPDSDEEPAAW
jgi:regulatory protein